MAGRRDGGRARESLWEKHTQPARPNHTYFPYSHHPEGLIRLGWLLHDSLVQWDYVTHPLQINTDKQVGGRTPGVSPAYSNSLHFRGLQAPVESTVVSACSRPWVTIELL